MPIMPITLNGLVAIYLFMKMCMYIMYFNQMDQPLLRRRCYQISITCDTFVVIALLYLELVKLYAEGFFL